MVEAVIFDMDGVIIDSEPFWREAEIEVFTNIGVVMTEEMCMQMKGTKISDVVKHWYSLFPWETPPLKIVEENVIAKVISLICEKGEAMGGLVDLLTQLKNKGVKIAVATSSTFKIMNATLDKLRIKDYFDVKHSAEAEKYGKPAPDVYIGAAKLLSVSPENCVAIEDSLAGIRAAKAAGMYAIALPEVFDFNDKGFEEADIKIRSLDQVFRLGILN